MKISLIHPTARVRPPYPSFPTGWWEAMEEFYAKCDHPEDVEYVVVVHQDNWEAFARNWPFLPNEFGGIQWGSWRLETNIGPNTGVSQVNAGFAAATGDLLLGIQDDLFPPEHWDTLLCDEALKELDKIDTRYLMRSIVAQSSSVLIQDAGRILHALFHFSTGSSSDKELIVCGALTRALYDSWGYVLHPSYESMFADNELTAVSRRDGVVVDCLHIQFEHRHPMLGKAEMDEVYALENRAEAYRAGARNFALREAHNFPKEQPKAQPRISIITPGESFSMHWVAAHRQVVTNLFAMGWQVYCWNGFSSSVFTTRMSAVRQILENPDGADFVLWVDDDNIVMFEHVWQLIQDLEAHPELDGVTGWCWCDNGDDQSKWRVSCGRQSEKMELQRFTAQDFEHHDSEIMPIDWTGFPCLLMRMTAVEKLGEAAFLPIINPELQYGYATEDASYFWRAREMGMKFAVDWRVKVAHEKRRAIEPQVIELHSQVDEPGKVMVHEAF